MKGAMRVVEGKEGEVSTELGGDRMVSELLSRENVGKLENGRERVKLLSEWLAQREK